MSLTDEEKDMVIREAVDNLYYEIILPCVMTKHDLLNYIDQLLTEKGL